MEGRTKLCVRKDFAFHMIQNTSIYDLTDRSVTEEKETWTMDHGWVLSVTAASAPAFRWGISGIMFPASGKILNGLFSVAGGWLAG